MSDQEKLQALFEKISDRYVGGHVTLNTITPQYMEITFIGENGKEKGHTHIQIYDACAMREDGAQGARLDLIIMEYGDIIISRDAISAIIAVACR